MQPLIDSDILLYEIGFSSQKTEGGVVEPASWDFAQNLLEKKIDLICDEVGATKPPLLFLTNTPRITKLLNKQRKREDKPQKEHVENFRNALAIEKEYKGGRKPDKPFHYYNLLAHILGSYDYRVHENGLEADDYMCITQYKSWQEGDTIICSRDKDVRQCPGNHYSWEVAKQPSIGPIFVEPLGYLELQEKVDKKGAKTNKLFGVGAKFFYAQLLTGDTVDNIGGLKGRGPVFAYDLLHDLTTERDCYEYVAEVYVKTYDDDWKVKIKEQADLLYMIREEEDGVPKRWLPPPKHVKEME